MISLIPYFLLPKLYFDFGKSCLNLNHKIFVIQLFIEQWGTLLKILLIFICTFSVCVESEIFRISGPVKLFLNADKLITNNIVRAFTSQCPINFTNVDNIFVIQFFFVTKFF